MSNDDSVLDIINRVFAEAARTEGDDPLAVVDRVKALIERLEPGDRRAVRAAFENMTSFAAEWSAVDTRH